MTKEGRLAVALGEVRRRLARDGFRDQLRAEARLLKEHPSSADGNAFVEAALADLAEELTASRRSGKRRGLMSPWPQLEAATATSASPSRVRR
jgi:hypothetical protein